MRTRTAVLLALVPACVYCLISSNTQRVASFHPHSFLTFKKTFSAFYFSAFFVILFN